MPPKKPILVAAPPAPIDINPRTDPPLDFPDRPLAEMTPADYDELGFLCGLEVHQQLLTPDKLFCRCPSGVRSSRVDMEILRHMRPTLSEMGEYDGTALMEFKTKKDIVYQLDRETVCTYEIDDTPPFPINEKAVRIALEVTQLLGQSPVSELQVMRKQYLDGSIPTGFQRTTMIGLGGSIPLQGSELGPGREVRIRQLTLEEDACREVSDVGHRVVFRLDRLGTPLIETVTEPDLLTPRDVETCGRLIARIAQATNQVRRGAGAGRQDVNVSIAGSRRVELKGVCRHRGLPLLVHNEAFRHLNLLRIRAELIRRGVPANLFETAPGSAALESPLVVDATTLTRSSDFGPLVTARDLGHTVLAVRLPGFRGLLGHGTQPGRTLLHEFAERMRVIACVEAEPWILHDAGSELSESTWREVRRTLAADEDDALLCVWGPEADADTAACETLIRAADAFVGVPSETRQTHPDGTTGFERILPGPERMYPDTDMPAVPLPDAWHSEIRERLPERPWERAERYLRLGLSASAAARLAGAPWADLFDELGPRSEACARRLAAAFEKRLVHAWRRSGARVVPEAAHLAPLVAAVDEGSVRPEALERGIDRLLADPEAEPAAVVAELRPAADDEARLRRELLELLASGAEERHGRDAFLRWCMGRVMPRFLGKLAPSVVESHLRDALERKRVGSEEIA